MPILSEEDLRKLVKDAPKAKPRALLHPAPALIRRRRLQPAAARAVAKRSCAILAQ